MRALEPHKITWAAHIACLMEVCADKPGNVTWGKDFWDTRFVDFMASAVAVGPAFGNVAQTPVGETILRATTDTQKLARTNTNLGMILLLAPLAKAAALGHPQGLRAGVAQVLEKLTVEDAKLAFEAIRLASPRGLGQAEKYDVRNSKVDVTLLDAMRLAQYRDNVAREYVTNFEITFELGIETLGKFYQAGHAFSDAVVQTFLTILAQIPDTLIVRKEGEATAKLVSEQAQRVLQSGGAFADQGRKMLEEFDHNIRDERHRLNPGTTADLIAATLFAFLTEGDGLENFPELLSRW